MGKGNPALLLPSSPSLPILFLPSAHTHAPGHSVYKPHFMLLEEVHMILRIFYMILYDFQQIFYMIFSKYFIRFPPNYQFHKAICIQTSS